MSEADRLRAAIDEAARYDIRYWYDGRGHVAVLVLADALEEEGSPYGPFLRRWLHTPGAGQGPVIEAVRQSDGYPLWRVRGWSVVRAWDPPASRGGERLHDTPEHRIATDTLAACGGWGAWQPLWCEYLALTDAVLALSVASALHGMPHRPEDVVTPRGRRWGYPCDCQRYGQSPCALGHREWDALGGAGMFRTAPGELAPCGWKTYATHTEAALALARVLAYPLAYDHFPAVVPAVTGGQP